MGGGKKELWGDESLLLQGLMDVQRGRAKTEGVKEQYDGTNVFPFTRRQGPNGADLGVHDGGSGKKVGASWGR